MNREFLTIYITLAVIFTTMNITLLAQRKRSKDERHTNKFNKRTLSKLQHVDMSLFYEHAHETIALPVHIQSLLLSKQI